MKHIFKEGKNGNKRTLLLLHGTGGNEQDMLPIADMIDDSASVLSVRGNVSEHGMARFFRRLSEGVFDEEDLIFRTNELNEFVDKSAVDYGFDRHRVIAIGYSNGANIAASLLFHFENALNGAILLHPMVPRRGIELPNLNGTSVFIGAGTNDPLCLPQESKDLAGLLEGVGAEVDVHWANMGHQLSQSEIEGATLWYKSLK